CWFVIPDTQSDGTNGNRQFWVGQQAGDVPVGWYTNPSLRTGGTNHPPSNQAPYRFQTPGMIGGQAYTSGDANFMPVGNNTSSSSGLNYSEGIWQQSRVNPALPAQCGLNVALVMDLSSSMTSANVQSMIGAANTF